MDPSVIVHYDMQNDAGTSFLTNMAMGNARDPSMVPSNLDAQILDWSQSPFPLLSVNYPGQVAALWSNSGRFPGKPALSFNPTLTPNAMAYIGQRNNGIGRIANMLRKTQAYTLLYWVYVPRPAVDNQLFVYWAGKGNSAQIVVTTDMAWGGNVNASQGSGFGGSPTMTSFSTGTGAIPFTYGQDSRWNLFAFTSDRRSGVAKLYQNGVLVAYQQSGNQLIVGPDVAYPTGSDPGALVFGNWPNHGENNIVCDEFGLFDSDLSPNDPLILGTISPRFFPMYTVGVN